MLRRLFQGQPFRRCDVRWIRLRVDSIRSTVRIAVVPAVPIVIILVFSVFAVLDPGAPTPATAATAITGIHVAGNQLVDDNNHSVVLRGVNRSGSEYGCIQGWGVFDGPNVMNDDAQVPLMQNWGINEVNLGINEDCWLNINGVPAAYGGANYVNAIVHETQTLESYGIYPVISLFWEAPGSAQAKDQSAMPDNDHAPAVWQSLANTFKNDPRVILRLKEEPYPAGNSDGAAAWQCWKNGDVQYDASGSLTPVSQTTNCSEGYKAAGMQSLINIIRGTGATNVIQVPGVQYANSMTHFLDSAYRVSDTLGTPQLMGVVDVYPNGNTCGSTTCWQNEYVPVMNVMPFMAGEFGESVDGTDCTTAGVDALMGLFDQHGAGYSAWVWDTWGGCLQLITSYSTGAPNGNWGNDYKAHVLSLVGSSSSGSSTATPTATKTLQSTATASPTPTRTQTASPSATRTSTPGTASTPTLTATASPSSTAVVTTSSGVFSDGFESGTLPGAWSATVVNGGDSLSVDPTLAHSGISSLKAVEPRGSKGNANVSKTLPSGQSALDVRGYYYLSNPVRRGSVHLLSVYSGSTLFGSVIYNVDPSRPSLQVYNPATGQSSTCSNVPTLNTWHSLELRYVLSTVAGSFNLWLDGMPACGATNVKTMAQPGTLMNRVVVGINSASSMVGLTVHVDDVVVSGSYIGP